MRRRRIKTRPNRGSYLPVLIRLVEMTRGPILEMGCGGYSTPYLHWACYAAKRRLVSYENDPEFFDYASKFNNDYHKVYTTTDLDSIDLSEPWSIAFIDHCPAGRRAIETAKVTHAEYVVGHDAEQEADHDYQFSSTFHLFKYRWIYKGAKPPTLVMSNFHKLDKFSVARWPPEVEPPPLDAFVPIPESKMEQTHPGIRRRYTICRALREIFVKTDDPETRTKLRYACVLAEHITRKINHHDPLWLDEFYPRRSEFARVMGNKGEYVPPDLVAPESKT